MSSIHSSCAINSLMKRPCCIISLFLDRTISPRLGSSSRRLRSKIGTSAVYSRSYSNISLTNSVVPVTRYGYKLTPPRSSRSIHSSIPPPATSAPIPHSTTTQTTSPDPSVVDIELLQSLYDRKEYTSVFDAYRSFRAVHDVIPFEIYNLMLKVCVDIADLSAAEVIFADIMKIYPPPSADPSKPIPEYDNQIPMEVFQSYANVALHISRESLKLEDLLNFSSGCGEILKEYNVKDPTVWTTLVDSLLVGYGKHYGGRYQLQCGTVAVELLNQMEQNKISVSHSAWLQRLVKAHGYRQDHSTVIKLLRSFSNSSSINFSEIEKSLIYSTFIAAISRCGKATTAYNLTQKILNKKIPPTVEALWCLMTVFARDGNRQVVESLHEIFVSIYDVHQDGEFDLYSPVLELYATLLRKDRFSRHFTMEDSESRRELHPRWVDILTQMKEKEIRFDQDIYEKVITCHVFSNYDDYARFPMNAASAMLEEMIDSGIPPTEYAFHTVMRGYVNTREPIGYSRKKEKVIKAFIDAMKSVNLTPTSETYSIWMLCFLPQRKLVQQLPWSLPSLKTAEKEMMESGIEHTSQSMDAMLRVLGANHYFNEMYQRFHSMPEQNITRSSHTFFTVLHACKDYPYSAQYALTIIYPELLKQEEIELDSTLYHTLIACCVSSNDMDLAWSLFNEMKSKQLNPTITIYNYLLKLYLFYQDRRGQDVLLEMRDNKITYDATTYYHLLTYFTKINPDKDKLNEVLKMIGEQNKKVDMLVEAAGENFQLPSSLLSMPIEFPPKETSETSIPDEYSFLIDDLSLPAGIESDVVQNDADSLQTETQPLTSDIIELPDLKSFIFDTKESRIAPKINIDNRMQLKILQAYTDSNDIPQAIRLFSDILFTYQSQVMKRTSKSIAYRHQLSEGSSLIPTSPYHHVNVQELPRYLSFPPKIVNAHPSFPGNLYLPRDVATATWLTCNVLLSNSHLQTEPSQSQISAVKLPIIKHRKLMVEYKNTVDMSNQEIARMLFMRSFMILKKSVGTRVIGRFTWVRDLSKRLGLEKGVQNARLDQMDQEEKEQIMRRKEFVRESSGVEDVE
ncbi:hypothetical protein BKA69DRAFT_1039118 [Paraphysoderma sedebokerense]|nr:hypothetical protein BKA69DRAFT_1039118 [Paraphysoderma sedebokerense]